jgi:hypothetical protein
MGVFARLFRWSKAAEEVTATEEPADAATVGSEADGVAAGESAEATEVTEAQDGNSGVQDGRAGGVGPDDAGAGRPADGAAIPGQQSADEAVEHGAGEGART